MKVVLAEKPSVAREIAGFLQAKARREGYFEGGGYQVTWAYGHLVRLKDPDEYDPAWKKWALETLPMLPERFELKQVPDKLGRQQFAVVKRLFRAADEIICATDAGREGELIFRYILTLAGCSRKPFRRLWLSSLTPKAIRDAFAKLRPGHDFDNLYAAARCRSEADWIVGMNGTRNYTVRFGAGGLLWSVGRVQTPVLAMIVRRDDEIRTFRPEPFWELLTVYRDVQFKYDGDRFGKADEAQRLLDAVRGRPFTVAKVQRKRERSQPPQLYDLTELQRDMNRRYGLSAAATLEAAQSLYESKRITYPRTDSRYLGNDMRREVPQILSDLRSIRADDIDRLDLQALRFTGRIINDAKVSDHHAILPTGKTATELSGPQQKVFDAIVTRLIAAFYPPCEKEVTTVHGRVAQTPFRARGYRVIDPGWTALYPRKPKGKDRSDEAAGGEGSQELPEFTPGESGPHQPSVKQGETSPPKPYTENTLLGAMETAGRLVDEESLREALKEKGLGTPATRAAIIETLLKRNYIQRQQKTLSATDLGRYLIAVVQDPQLKSPELTGQWESELRQIEASRLSAAQFMSQVVTYTRRVVAQDAAPQVDEDRLGDCPLCGRPVIQGKRGFGCSGWRDGCPFVLWPNYGERSLSVPEIRELLQLRRRLQPVGSAEHQALLVLTDNGQLTEVPLPSRDRQPRGKGGRSRRSAKSGQPRTAKGRKRSAAGAPTEAAEPEKKTADGDSLGTCPRCGAAVIEQKKSYSCSGWRSGCRFVIWKTVAGKRISRKTAQTLLSSGHTSRLKGFKSKAGKPFEASLKLVDDGVKFEFDL